jgi:hypothetical protein
MNTKMLVASLALVLGLVACPGGGGTQVQSGYHIEAKGTYTMYADICFYEISGQLCCGLVGDVSDGFKFDLEPDGAKWKAINIENDEAIFTNTDKYMSSSKITLTGPFNYLQIKEGFAEPLPGNFSQIRWIVDGVTISSGCKIITSNGDVYSGNSREALARKLSFIDMKKVEQEPQTIIDTTTFGQKWTFIVSKR